jgi:glucokinase
MAGEIGHIVVEPFGAPCPCGSQGCVEQYASATAIVRIAGELAGDYPESALRINEKSSALEIFQAGKNGDQLALEVFRRMGFYLGVALSNLLNILNHEVIVIGGGAGAGWELFMPELLETIRQRSYGKQGEKIPIKPSDLGDDAGIIGAARLAFDSPH